MDMTAWLFTIKDELDDLERDRDWEFWTTARRDRATGAILRRLDGEPFTPQWRAGEDVVVYHPASKRCVALFTLDGPARWDAELEEFLTATTPTNFTRSGPTLADIGVKRAVQGGRQRLKPGPHGAAVKHFRLAQAP